MSELNIVVALSWEAKPIIRDLGLSDCRGAGPFPLYSNGKGVNLIVSGIGQLNVALATAFLAGLQQGSVAASHCWLNIGIAGHSTYAPGTVLMANKISLGNSRTAVSYYPSMLSAAACLTSAVITVDEVETQYSQEAAYEMEAYSFYSSATRFAAQELIQVLKVVSDGPQHSVGAVTRESVARWMEQLVEPMGELMENLKELANGYNKVYAVGSEVHACVERWHFTATERQRLKRLYLFLSAAGEAGIFSDLLRSAANGPANERGAPILARLEQHAARLSGEP